LDAVSCVDEEDLDEDDIGNECKSVVHCAGKVASE
jgi:hypothetical protein